MGLRFGKSEDITCIVDVGVKLPNEGRDLCLAYKTTTTWVGAGVWVSDDGYVLRLKNDTTMYYPLPEGAREGHLAGMPHPLPKYSLSFGDWAWGTSLWWCIALTIVWYQGVKVHRRRKQAALVERMKTAPLDLGPPRVVGVGDRALVNLVFPRLVPGEVVHHQAYALSWDESTEAAGSEAFFLVLTDRRLMCLWTRIGAVGILYEANGETSTPRSAIIDARVDHGSVLRVTTNDGRRQSYFVKDTKALANQEAFLLNVPRLLSGAASRAA
jgi:hypothetical protein